MAKFDITAAFQAAVGAAGNVSKLDTSRETIEYIMDRLGLGDCLDFVIGSSDVKHHKPHPEGLEMALDRLGLPPERVLYCGDTVLDAEAAQRAGLEFAAVLNGTTPASAFDVWPHVFLARDLDALARFLEGRTRPAV